MLKSNKNLEPVSLWVPNLHEERDTGFPFPNPSPQTRKGIEKGGAVAPAIFKNIA